MADLEYREFEVGDVIVSKSLYSTEKRVVTRVTKTQAICEVKRDDGTGYISRFKKKYCVLDGNHRVHLDCVPYIRFSTTEYFVYPKNEK